MRQPGRPRSRLAVAASTLLLAALGILATAAPVAAECMAFDTWPSFRDRAPGSPRIVVSRVDEAFSTDSTNRAVGFRLRVQEVLRGRAGEAMTFDGIRPPPPLECRDSVLRVRVGDVVALAFAAPTGDAVRAVAFVEGRPDRFLLPGMERITRAELQRLAGDLPPTDASAPTDATDDPWARATGGPASAGVPATLAGVLAAMATLGWLRRRSCPDGGAARSTRSRDAV